MPHTVVMQTIKIHSINSSNNMTLKHLIPKVVFKKHDIKCFQLCSLQGMTLKGMTLTNTGELS